MIYQVVRGELGTQLFQAAAGFMMGALTNRPVRFLPLADELEPENNRFLLALINPQFANDVASYEALPADIIALSEPPQGASVEKMVEIANQGPQPLLMDGSWCSEMYWETLSNQAEFESQLRYAFTPRFDDSAIVENAREIASQPYIGIHVRRQEYGHHGLARASYYRNAVNDIRRQYGQLPALVFSDEPRVTHAMFHDMQDVAILECNREVPTFDLYMLSQCTHYILANSPDSFWAAMIGAESDSIVYFPGQSDAVRLGRRAKNWRVINGALQFL